MVRDKVYQKLNRADLNKVVLSYALIVVSFWLAINAFIASRYIDGDAMEYVGNNLYLSSSVSLDAEWASIVERESPGLEFMVWEHERVDLSLRLSQVLEQRINIDPFNGTLWMQLSYLQKEAGVSLKERAWTIERAARLLKWNLNERSDLSHYCIAEYAEFQDVSSDLCSSLILNLPEHWTEGQKAVNSNVTVSDLRAVLVSEKAKLENGANQ